MYKFHVLISALVGVVTGYFTIHSMFAHSWTSMILWVVVGLVILYMSHNRKTALYAGAVYGSCTIATWLVSGFQGTPDHLQGFLVLTFGLSVLGAACGAVGALIFFWLAKRK